MRNKRFFIVLIGALIFGVLAAVSVSKYLSSAQAYTKNLNKIAVAKVAIPIGSKISPSRTIRSWLLPGCAQPRFCERRRAATSDMEGHVWQIG